MRRIREGRTIREDPRARRPAAERLFVTWGGVSPSKKRCRVASAWTVCLLMARPPPALARPQPRVSIIMVGDELRMPGEEIEPLLQRGEQKRLGRRRDDLVHGRGG